MMFIKSILIWMVLWKTASTEVPRSSGPLSEVVAIEGGTTMLPCNITSPKIGDSPILVLFYNGVTGMPVYSIDARNGPLHDALHWTDLGDRASFDMNSSPQGLIINSIEASDGGDYRCRVDFGASPTRNLRVKLMVVVPPRRITIVNQAGLELSGLIGPFPVRGSLTLSCQTYGGTPKPQISWYHEHHILDEVMEYNSGDISLNNLTLPNLSRQHLYRVLTCKASNSNMSKPLTASVTLDMTFPPSEVRILDSNSPMSEGERYKMVCEALGSKPAASLSWWLDTVLIPGSRDQILNDGNMTRSFVYIEPNREDNEAILSCRAENSLLEGAAVEDSKKLDVHYSPKLQLRAGLSIDISNIKEGDDIYFECDIQANPQVSRVQWFLNGDQLVHNKLGGIILSNHSLVLQRVNRNSSGFYTCRGTNIIGNASSNAVELRVKFSPVCAEGQKWVYGSGRRQTVNVSCEVEGHPPASFFMWAFNTSSEYMEMPREDIHSEMGRSIATYTPETHHDFGSLLCWGVNDVRKQHQPCVFHVVPAAPPESVYNCSAWHNASAAGEVVVACQAGWSGGLAQSFSLEVREGPEGNVLAALRDQPEPHFTVTGLAPGSEYELAVVATNAQGFAIPTKIIYITPIDVAEKRTSAAAADSDETLRSFAMTPLIAIAIGVISSVLLLSLIILLVFIHIRKSAQSRNSITQTQTKIIYDEAPQNNTNGGDEGGFIQQKPLNQDAQPDIILVKTDIVESADSEVSLIHDRSLPLNESYCDSSSSLINNVGFLPCETDSLLKSVAKDSNRIMGSSSSTSAPFHTGSLGRRTYSSIDRDTPPVSYTESTYSLRRQKGFHSQDSDCDSAQIPLVSSSQSGTRESCV